MPTEILLLCARHAGTTSIGQNTELSASARVNFEKECDVRILSITSSGWLLSMRNSLEGGSRNSTPMFGVLLGGRGQDVAGPVHNSLDFTRVSGLTLWLRVPHFLLADPVRQATWKYDMVIACYYELL